MVTLLSKWSCKLDDSQDGSMLEGPPIILNPNRPHCCPLPQGQGLHWGTLPPACWNMFFQFFPILQPACLDWHPPRVEIPKLACKRSGLCGGQNLVVLMRACKLLRTSCTEHFCPATLPVLSHLHPLCTPRASPFTHQRLLWGIRGSNSPWIEFVCRHGSCLLTKRGSKQHRHRPKQTKISHMSSVQHADPGVPNSPFQGLSEYTPQNPTSGTLSWPKSGNNGTNS